MAKIAFLAVFSLFETFSLAQPFSPLTFLVIVAFCHLTLSRMGGFQIPPLLNRYPLFLKQREDRQLETTQHFDKALKCSCFDTIKKFLGTLGKRWDHAKYSQKLNILTTRGFTPFGIGLKKQTVRDPFYAVNSTLNEITMTPSQQLEQIPCCTGCAKVNCIK